MRILPDDEKGETADDNIVNIVKKPAKYGLTQQQKLQNNTSSTTTSNRSSNSSHNLNMGVKKEVTDAVCVDDITKGISSCHISHKESSATRDLAGQLDNLTLHDKKPAVKTEKPSLNKAPSEDDERSEEEKKEEEVKKEVEDVKEEQVTSRTALVKLEAPSVEENDECEGKQEGDENDHSGSIQERGPQGGIPVDNGNNYIASKPCMPYGSLAANMNGGYMATMPQGFPNYSDYHQNGSGIPGEKQKRGIEEREFYHEPQKYVRPQDEAGYTSGMNNLNAPCSMRKVSSVYQKQMSGGTVITPDDLPSDEFINQLGNNLVQQPQQYQQPDQMYGYQQSFQPQMFERQDSMGIQDFCFEDPSELNIKFDVDTLLPSGDSMNSGELGGVLIGEPGMQQQQQQQATLWQQQQQPNIPQQMVSLPPVSSFTSPPAPMQQQNQPPLYHPQQHQYDTGDIFNNQQQQQQHLQGSETYGVAGKRGSFGDDRLSDGYASDLSPAHESPSPALSHMVVSPAAPNASPPRTNYSPPPSNYSEDSGVHSPMSDESNGYCGTQMNSPRHMVSTNGFMPLAQSPRQGKTAAFSPGRCTMSPHVYQVSSPVCNMSPMHVTSPVSTKMPTESTEEEYYHNSYIDQNLEGLNDALAIASKDLMDESRRMSQSKTPFAPTNTNVNGKLVGAVGASTVSTVVPNIPNVVRSSPQNAAPAPAPQVAVSGDLRTARKQEKSGGVVAQAQAVPVQIAASTNNMPNIVPTTITVTSPGSQNKRGSNVKNAGQIQALQPGSTYIITTCNNIMSSNMQPPVNSQGKIAIPQLPQRKANPGPTQMLPVIVSNGVILNLQTAPVKQAPRFAPIAPKDSTKQTDTNGKSGSGSPAAQPTRNGGAPNKFSSGAANNVSNGGAGPRSQPASPDQPANKKNQNKRRSEKLLNLARRTVAAMSTDDLKYHDEDGDTYLHVTVCQDEPCMVQALLERLDRESMKEMMINVPNIMGQTPLYLAVSTNNVELVQLFVEAGADVNPFAECMLPTGVREKSAAIHCASSKGHTYLDTLRALIRAKNVNLNQVNSDGHTALHCAILAHGKKTADGAHINSIPIIQALIHAGADPNLQVQQSGKTALMYALESRDLDLIESTFQLVEPSRLAGYLKTQAFDSSTCYRIAESFKSTLDPAGQQRLASCLKAGHSRSLMMSSSSPTRVQ